MGLSKDDFIAGWIGGTAGLVAGHPLDTIKVRQQAYGETFLRATLRTYKYEKVRGFFKGLLFPLLTTGPSNAIFFGIYGNVLDVLHGPEKRVREISPENIATIHRVFVAGLVAGFFQALFMCPVDLIKIVRQARTGGRGSWREHFENPYRGSVEAFRGIFHKYGVRGLYRGLTPMIIRDVPTSGIYMLTYETLMYYTFVEWKTPTKVKEMLAGGTAGVTCWAGVVPFDVVKSKIQADNPEKPLYKGTIDCIVKCYRKSGIKTFFRGFPAITVRAFIVNGMTFIGYESAMSTLFPQHYD